jgi:hypothetical protein
MGSTRSDHFAQRILANHAPENAGAEDALRASRLCHAAIGAATPTRSFFSTEKPAVRNGGFRLTRAKRGERHSA